jgi:hypothetical protein
VRERGDAHVPVNRAGVVLAVQRPVEPAQLVHHAEDGPPIGVHEDGPPSRLVVLSQPELPREGEGGSVGADKGKHHEAGSQLHLRARSAQVGLRPRERLRGRQGSRSRHGRRGPGVRPEGDQLPVPDAGRHLPAPERNTAHQAVEGDDPGVGAGVVVGPAQAQVGGRHAEQGRPAVDEAADRLLGGLLRPDASEGDSSAERPVDGAGRGVDPHPPRSAGIVRERAPGGRA